MLELRARTRLFQMRAERSAVMVIAHRGWAAPVGRLTGEWGKMKILLLSGLIGAAIGGAVVRPAAVTDLIGAADTVVDLYDSVFPSDPLKREALDLCFRQNHGFNRLVTAERQSCYAAVLPTQQAAAQGGIRNLGLHAANFVDLWQAAGQGHMPKNDIRAQQHAAQVFHPAAARFAP
jgi:hypothetical protein